MEEMAEDSEENYNKHFSQFIAANVAGDGLEDVYKKVWSLVQRITYSTAAQCLYISDAPICLGRLSRWTLFDICLGLSCHCDTCLCAHSTWPASASEKQTTSLFGFRVASHAYAVERYSCQALLWTPACMQSALPRRAVLCTMHRVKACR